jgi:hypothetical protein
VSDAQKPAGGAYPREDGTVQLLARRFGHVLITRPASHPVRQVRMDTVGESSLFVNEEQARAIYADLHGMFGEKP